MTAPEREPERETGEQRRARYDADDVRSLRERVAETGWRKRLAARRSVNHGYRIGVGIVGSLIVAFGLVTIPLPGPGRGMATRPMATTSAPTTPTAIRYGWFTVRRVAMRRRQRVSAIRSRRLRDSGEASVSGLLSWSPARSRRPPSGATEPSDRVRG